MLANISHYFPQAQAEHICSGRRSEHLLESCISFRLRSACNVSLHQSQLSRPTSSARVPLYNSSYTFPHPPWQTSCWSSSTSSPKQAQIRFIDFLQVDSVSWFIMFMMRVSSGRTASTRHNEENKCSSICVKLQLNESSCSTLLSAGMLYQAHLLIRMMNLKNGMTLKSEN